MALGLAVAVTACVSHAYEIPMKGVGSVYTTHHGRGLGVPRRYRCEGGALLRWG